MPTTCSIPLRIEFSFNPNQPRAKDGRWTRAGGGPAFRAGKGFGGLSAPRDQRTAPTPKFSLPPKGKELDALGFTEGTLKERRKAFYKSIYEHELPGGYKSKVTEVRDDGTHVYIRGEIQNKWGSGHGSFERDISDAHEYYDASHIEPSEYGPAYQNLKATSGVAVYHTSFELDSDDHRAGVGSAFIAGSVAKYRELGIDHVKVHAGDSVGGYAWAREGFRIEEGQRDRDPYGSGTYQRRHDLMHPVLAHAEGQLFRLGKEREIPDEHYAEIGDALKALRSASQAGQDVQPIHIASLGEATMRYKKETYDGGFYETWPGKEMMLGSNWRGTYYFDANRAVTAAATGFNPNQPRDKDGRWTAFRAGLTSLSRDTLDRALNHGMAGIFSDAPTGTTPWPTAPRRKGEKVYKPELVAEALRKPPVLQKVDPRMLFATQPGLVKAHVNYYLTDEYKRTGRTAADRDNAGNAFPVIYVNQRGQQIILTGHHRAAAAMIQGQDLDAIVVREPA